jgi:protein involved in polysaccharide export with SLBB domain
MSMAVGAAMSWAAVGCGTPAQVAQPMQLAAYAQEPAQPDSLRMDPEHQAYTDARGAPEYLLGPDDVLEITLRDVDVSKETVAVRPDGYVSFSLVENVRASGLTANQVDEAITRELSRFLRSPKVDVAVTQFRSKMVSVLGAVQTVVTSGTKSGQGRYPLRTKTTVLDIILEAGGTTSDAQLDRVQLIRGDHSYRLNLQRVLNTGDQRPNAVLQGGDIVIVPGTSQLSKKVVVLGEVRGSGVYMFAEDVSLVEALGRAGGLTTSALRDDVRVIRGLGSQPEMFSVDYARITGLGELQRNLTLENNDIVYVPRSFVGDINEALAKVEPLLNVLLLPATFRDLYTTGGGLRLDTGTPVTGGTTVFTRSLPGTAASKPVDTQEKAEEEKKAKKE